MAGWLVGWLVGWSVGWLVGLPMFTIKFGGFNGIFMRDTSGNNGYTLW
jgi:hypothetical protein